MRHRRRTKYFGVKSAHRKAMFRNMVTSLFRHGRITTTVTRAKELRRVAEKLVSLAKEGSLHSRRQALSFIMDKAVVAKLFSEIAPKMVDRRGGYTRIVRIGPRRGDGAMMCLIELVHESLQVKKPAKKKREEEGATQVAPAVIPTASTEEEVAKDVEASPEDTETPAIHDVATDSPEDETSSNAGEELHSITSESEAISQGETEDSQIESPSTDLDSKDGEQEQPSEKND